MALATSTYFIFADLGIGIGPFLLGFLIPEHRLSRIICILAIVVFACIVLYYFMHGRQVGRVQNKLRR